MGSNITENGIKESEEWMKWKTMKIDVIIAIVQASQNNTRHADNHFPH